MSADRKEKPTAEREIAVIAGIARDRRDRKSKTQDL
jgi:hypothetical protein